MPGAHRRVEHEQPDQDARRADQRAGEIKQEPEDAGALAPRRAAEGQDEDQDHQDHKPDHQVERDMLEGGHEPEVLGGRDEVGEPLNLPCAR